MKIKGDPQWTMRRRVVNSTLVACLVLSVFAIYRDDGSGGLAGAVLMPVAMLAGSVVGSYVFGAAWERVRGVTSGNYFDGQGASGGDWERRW